MTQHNALPSAHPAFEPLRQREIDSLNITVEQFQHRSTGAMHYHLASENSENVFLVALRTVPVDSTGVAHILEHTALCGSERFPVRDPFFMMLRRSLNTFMNAFTSSDWTAYPFASQNRKDFANLLDVYLDAVFFSRLEPLDFAQEGHRVEFEEPDNPNSDLVFKGVVFNEMKGAMSGITSTLWDALCRHLFPTSTYHYNSGGDPAHIPDLTYDQLNAFYRRHYHPGNAIFMTFGDIQAKEHQAVFEDRALQHFTEPEGRIVVEPEMRLAQPLRAEEHYAFDEAAPLDEKTHIVLGWMARRKCRPGATAGGAVVVKCPSWTTAHPRYNMPWRQRNWDAPRRPCAAWRIPCASWCSAVAWRAVKVNVPKHSKHSSLM